MRALLPVLLLVSACVTEDPEPEPTPPPAVEDPTPPPHPVVHRCAAAGRVETPEGSAEGFRTTLCLGPQDLAGPSASDTLFISYPGPIRSVEP